MFKLPAKYSLRVPKLAYFAVLLLVILIVGFYLFEVFGRSRQISGKKQFIGMVSSNLVSADQSLDEVVKSLDIIDSNYKKAISSDSGLEGAQYAVVIGDNQKSLSQVETTKENLGFQEGLVARAKAPKEYEDLRIDFINYYSQADKLLLSLVDNFTFENNILKVIATNSNQDKIIKSDVWQKANKDEIINYYKDLKNQAVLTLGELSKIKASDKFLNYYNLEKSYFEFIGATADQVINALQKDEIVALGKDDPNQIERAYQTAFSAQANINNVTKQIIDERNRLLPLQVNRADFDYLASVQKSLEVKIKDYNQQLYKESRGKFALPFLGVYK